MRRRTYQLTFNKGKLMRGNGRKEQITRKGPVMVSFPMPFTELSRDERVEAAHKIAGAAAEEFAQALEATYAALLQVSPNQLLAAFSFYGLTNVRGDASEFAQEHPVLQHQVE